MNNNWYFDNITEEIIYRPIDGDGNFLKMIRELKRNLVIRKIASNNLKDTNYPEVLLDAVKLYNKSKGCLRK